MSGLRRGELGPFNIFLATAALTAMLVYYAMSEELCGQFFCKSVSDLIIEYIFMSVVYIFMAMAFSLADYYRREDFHWEMTPGSYAASFFDGFFVTSIALLLCMAGDFSHKYDLLLTTLLVASVLVAFLASIIFNKIEGRKLRKMRLRNIFCRRTTFIVVVFPIVLSITIGFITYIINFPIWSSASMSFGIRFMVDCLFEPLRDP